jgi:hypothetical protein
MGYIKKHKLSAFIIFVYIVLVVFAYFIYKLFIGSSGKAVYGNRLDGIEDVPITEEQKEELYNKISELDYVLSVTKPYLSGKIYKVVVTVKDTASVDQGRYVANLLEETITPEQRAFYDSEIYLNKYYSCSLEATGKVDEDGNFVEPVTVKFSDDLSKNDAVLEYGLSNTEELAYNKEQEYKISEDGEYIIYGFTRDSLENYSCSIKITKVTAEDNQSVVKTTVTSNMAQEYPIIGYRKYGTNTYSWTK